MHSLVLIWFLDESFLKRTEKAHEIHDRNTFNSEHEFWKRDAMFMALIALSTASSMECVLFALHSKRNVTFYDGSLSLLYELFEDEWDKVEFVFEEKSGTFLICQTNKFHQEIIIEMLIQAMDMLSPIFIQQRQKSDERFMRTKLDHNRGHYTTLSQMPLTRACPRLECCISRAIRTKLVHELDLSFRKDFRVAK
jgi:hypothetical protein